MSTLLVNARPVWVFTVTPKRSLPLGTERHRPFYFVTMREIPSPQSYLDSWLDLCRALGSPYQKKACRFESNCDLVALLAFLCFTELVGGRSGRLTAFAFKRRASQAVAACSFSTASHPFAPAARLRACLSRSLRASMIFSLAICVALAAFCLAPANIGEIKS